MRDAIECDWHDDASPAAASLAFLAGLDPDESGAALARFELTDDDERTLGTAVVPVDELSCSDAALTGTAVFHVSVVDGRVASLDYDRALSRDRQQQLEDRLDRLTDE